MSTTHEWADSMADWAVSNPAPRPEPRDELSHHFIDRMPEDYDMEDQSVSADAEVAIWLLKGLGVMFCVWVIVRYGHAF